MYFLRTLNTLKVDANIMTMFYNSTISTVLNYCHHLNRQTKNVLNRPRKKACKLIKEVNKNNIIEHSVLCNSKALSMTKKILIDDCHPLHSEFVFLRSGRRLDVPITRNNRFRNSFYASSHENLQF